MTEINRLTEAFIQLFGLTQLGARPILPDSPSTEQGLLPQGLYQQLKAIDDIQENPLSYTDIREFLNREGLKGLKHFYPHYSFRFGLHDKKIAVQIEYPELTSVVPAKDKEVKKIFKHGGLPINFAERLDCRISDREYVEGTPILIVLEDDHYSRSHKHFLWDLANQIFETSESRTLFYESVGGSIDHTPVIEERWSMLQRSNPGLQGLRFSDLPTFLSANASWRNALISSDPLLVIHAYYGERLKVLNPESPIPLFPDILDWGADLMVDDNPEIKQGNEALRKIAEAVRGLRLLGGEDSQMLLTPAFQNEDRLYRLAIDQRTKRWARNILAFAQDDQNFRLPPIYVLVGGRAHMPKLAEELKGKMTTLFLSPRPIL